MNPPMTLSPATPPQNTFLEPANSAFEFHAILYDVQQKKSHFVDHSSLHRNNAKK